MADDFDRFIASALAPADREPDRQFVATVQARLALEDRLAAQQRSLLSGFASQLVALLAVAAAIWWIARAAPVASWFAQSPALGLGVLLAGFAFLVGVLGIRPGVRIGSDSLL